MNRVHAVIANHKGKDGDATLARLVEQHCRLRFLEPLSSGRVTVREEEWTLDRLATLWLAHKRGNSRRMEGPLVVLRINGLDMLIDGNNRCHRLLTTRERASWPVLVVEIGE